MSRTAQQILQDEFLLARARILELAAIFDRIDRAVSEISACPPQDLDAFKQKLNLLAEGVTILQESQPSRASRVQKLMSRPYDPTWREQWTI